jgi:hypothetical protein
MNKKLLTVVLAGTVFTMTLLPAVSNAGNHGMGGQGLNNRTKSTQQLQDRQRLRDGSCLNTGTSGAAQKKGMRHGPGDGTGNQANCPQGRTKKEAPADQD